MRSESNDRSGSSCSIPGRRNLIVPLLALATAGCHDQRNASWPATTLIRPPPSPPSPPPSYPLPTVPRRPSVTLGPARIFVAESRPATVARLAAGQGQHSGRIARRRLAAVTGAGAIAGIGSSLVDVIASSPRGSRLRQRRRWAWCPQACAHRRSLGRIRLHRDAAEKAPARALTRHRRHHIDLAVPVTRGAITYAADARAVPARGITAIRMPYCGRAGAGGPGTAGRFNGRLRYDLAGHLRSPT